MSSLTAMAERAQPTVRTISLEELESDVALMAEVAALVQQGGVIISPTDTCYGFACSPSNEEAVGRIYHLKKRHHSEPLLLLADSLERVRGLMEEAPPYFEEIAEALWPAPLSLIVPASSKVPPFVRGGRRTVGIRLLDFGPLVTLMRIADLPLVSTSANRSGFPAPSSAEEIVALFGAEVELVVLGPEENPAKSSTVLDLTSSPPRILRRGEMGERVGEALKRIVAEPS